jgi:hypothetical protein
LRYGDSQSRRQEVAAAIKECAVAFEFDPTRFSTKSMRMGFSALATALDTSAMAEADGR